MPLPVITNVTRVAFHWFDSHTGGDAVNVMHFRNTAGTVDDLLDEIEDWVTGGTPAHGPALWDAVSSGTYVDSMSATKLDGTSATIVRPVLGVSNTAWQGQSGGGSLPAVAATVSLATATRGRSHRGRIFLPTLGESAMTDGLVAGGIRTAMQVGWDDFLDQFNDPAGPGALVVASYKLHTSSDVTSLVVKSHVSTQRRRQKRLGSS
jgi:hypothetical protein